MKNKILILTIFLSLLLGSCTAKENNKNLSEEADYKGKEVIFVYDADDKLLFTLSEERERTILAEIIGEGAGNAGAENPFGIFKDKPKDAEVLYRYVLKNRDELRVNMYIFSNYKLAYMDDIPVVKSLIWELSDKDYEILTHPEKLMGEK
ncbi:MULTISPECIES: hypothetical protein [unclassified Treponema]|uniref:hypothetical protein n=1 Tax=unclassified Treponema TaxID=2638727 RepID=UPI0020A32189|nr:MULTISPECIES: hypothetical protein [unclassified Treponema]UTC67636.1 hypothetical protein E4O06_02905 [Treponema sp. OMZ 789]UTC70364.1 hypothetical protein E4O01_02895 [Treponema sp. OMZ 790]UTC73078.1 hypothetical protein E4O02_02895 [Treponema sp. OMZ 791]